MRKCIFINRLTLLFAVFNLSILALSCNSGNSKINQGLETSFSGTDTGMESPQGHGDHDMLMDLGPADKNYDLRFIDSMVLHHQGAIDMAQQVLQKSQRPEMKKLAKDIIIAQTKEIKEMEQWRKSWYPKAGDTRLMWHSEMNHSMSMSEKDKQTLMMTVNLGKGDKDFDRRFINAMIPHHEGALVMASDALQKSARPEIQKLSQDILASQEKEIQQMKGWNKQWYK